jgi:hypothetical protein
VRCGSLTNALELGLEFCFLVAIANVEEKIRVTALRELRGWNSSANAQHSRRSFSWLLTPDHPLVVNVIPTTHCDCCTLCHINLVADVPSWRHGKNIHFALDKKKISCRLLSELLRRRIAESNLVVHTSVILTHSVYWNAAELELGKELRDLELVVVDEMRR